MNKGTISMLAFFLLVFAAASPAMKNKCPGCGYKPNSHHNYLTGKDEWYFQGTVHPDHLPRNTLTKEYRFSGEAYEDHYIKEVGTKLETTALIDKTTGNAVVVATVKPKLERVPLGTKRAYESRELHACSCGNCKDRKADELLQQNCGIFSCFVKLLYCGNPY